jgi:hypothetical protein
MTISKKINPREKREELLALWERMFKLCEAQVTKMEAGTLDLTASMLKELNAFMKQSAVTLVELEKAQEADEAKSLMEAAESPSEPTGEPEEDVDAMPFPCASEPNEKQPDPLAVPLEY